LLLTSNWLQIRFHVGSPVTAVDSPAAVGPPVDAISSSVIVGSPIAAGSPVTEVGDRNLLFSYTAPDIWRNFYVKSVLCYMYGADKYPENCVAA